MATSGLSAPKAFATAVEIGSTVDEPEINIPLAVSLPELSEELSPPQAASGSARAATAARDQCFNFMCFSPK
jgi:hypothetical protein